MQAQYKGKKVNTTGDCRQMRIKLKMYEAQALLGVLRKHDGDATLRLSDKTRVRFGLNINALMGPVSVYELNQNKMRVELGVETPEGKLDPVSASAWVDRDQKMRDEVIKVNLKRINFDDLKSTRGGDHTITNLAPMACIIRDFEKAAGKEEDDEEGDVDDSEVDDETPVQN